MVRDGVRGQYLGQLDPVHFRLVQKCLGDMFNQFGVAFCFWPFLLSVLSVYYHTFGLKNIS